MRRNCDIPNPLVHGGTGQMDRHPAALDPEYVKVDERGPDELLRFIQRYAAMLQYYDVDNSPAGDWRPFVENDVSTVIALIAGTDTRALNNCYEMFKPAAAEATSFTTAVKLALSVIFDLVFTYAATFDGWYRRTLPGSGIHTDLNRMITAQLRQTLHAAIAAYHHAVDKRRVVAVAPIDIPLDCRKLILAADSLPAQPFHPDWIADPAVAGEPTVWEDYVEAIDPDGDGFTDAATAGNRVIAFYGTFYKALRQIIDRSPVFLKETLENWPHHEPHMALMLAFLKLAETARQDLNALTRRHLEFYYQKVLQLAPKPAQPHRVHLLVEPAKQVTTHALAKGTRLKAGKDAQGNNITYQTLREIVVNRAVVRSLKTVHIDRDDGHRVYAAPQADTKDGRGEAFETAEPRWKTFGESQRLSAAHYRQDKDRNMIFAAIGFALASPILQLAEGQRKITIRLTPTAATAPPALTPDQFEIHLSGAEGWLTAPSSSVTVNPSPLEIIIDLGPDFPAIVAYDPKVLNGDFDTPFPMLQVLLTNVDQAAPAYAYSALKNVVLTAIDLEVAVTGLRNLLVQNDSGILDAGKPFQPFGAQPVKGATLYVGSDEVFRKNLSRLKLKIEWLDVPDDDLSNHYAVYDQSFANDEFKVLVSELESNRWQALKDPNSPATDLSIDLFNSAATEPIERTVTSLTLARAPLLEPIERYDNRTQQGFIKLELAAPAHAFGHGEFAGLYTRQVLALNSYEQLAVKTGVAEPQLPEQPWTPVVKTLTLDYDSAVSFDLSPTPSAAADVDRLFHIYPFGQMRPRPTAAGAVRLMPGFQPADGGEPSENQGELYVGLADLDPPQQVALLFQMAEGSADPELPKQTVHWSYLAGEQWQSFASDEIVADGTDGLLTSGIIIFNVPAEADNRHTVLTDGLHWLRAGVTQNTAAVCDLIDIQAQAVTAEFVDQGNDPGLLAQPLPAKTIKKLVVKQAAVKQMIQPYASFGGAMAEKGRQYHTRVSERLRHKGRAVSIWDYERLVLEKFPEIHRAKCINHSTYNFADPDQDLTIDGSEFAPGFVTVVVIPRLDNQNAVDPLEPRASLHTLEQIRKHLGGLMSPFAAQRLKVINPLFEQIEVTFGVSFYPAYDRGEYEQRLNRDIIGFLSPWAYGQGRDIAFGGRVHRSVILNLIEERPYVDYVTDFSMDHIVGEIRHSDVEFALPTTSRSVFVSAPKHTINLASSCP